MNKKTSAYKKELAEKLDGFKKDKEHLNEIFGLSDEELAGLLAREEKYSKDELLYFIELLRKRNKGKFSKALAGLKNDILENPNDLSGIREELKQRLQRKNQNPKRLSAKFNAKKRNDDHEAMADILVKRLRYDIARALGYIENTGSEKRKEKSNNIIECLKKSLEKNNDNDIEKLLFETRKKLTAIVPKKVFEDILEKREPETLSEEDAIAQKIISIFGRDEDKNIAYSYDRLREIFQAVDEGEFKAILSHLMKKTRKLATLTGKDGQALYLCRDADIFTYAPDELIAILHRKYFDKVGKFIATAIDEEDGEIDPGYLKQKDRELQIPDEIVRQIIDCYVEKGVIQKSGNKYKLTKISGEKPPDYAMLRNVDLAKKYMNKEAAADDEKKIESAEQLYKQYWDKNTIDKIEMTFEKRNGVRVMHITEAMFGYKDLDVAFLYKLIGYIEKMPEDKRPDTIIISGLLFGNFQHKQKGNRRAKVFSENRQFAEAKRFLERCSELGIPIVYNISDNDLNIIESRTYDAIQIMQNLAKPQKDKEKKEASYYGFDRVKQSKIWEYHYGFQYDVAFEYMLRCGRRLYSADEMEAKYGIRVEEYLLLLEAYNALKNGQYVGHFAEEVLEIENIPVKNKKRDDFIITKNFDASFKTKKSIVKLHEEHENRQTEVTMVADTTKAARDLISQMEAMDMEVPDMFVVENQEACMGVLTGKTLILSTPAIHKYRLDQSSYAGMIKEDKGVRKAKVRREFYTPGAIDTEITDKGIIRVRFFNEHLMNIASKTRERMAVIHNSDWQTGSVTARPDLQAKWLDYAFHSVLTRFKGLMIFNGDIIQGRNYPEMPNENTNMGLVKIDDQMLFITALLDYILSEIPDDSKSNLELVGVVPGNHEWNSGHKNTGASYTLFLRDLFRRYNIPAKQYRTLATGQGEHLKNYTGIEDVADYKLVFQHMLMERGGKGSGGLPILQARNLISGVGGLLKEIDLLFGGHYHEPSFAMLNNKIASINGALAGLSGYEWLRAYRPIAASSVMYLGGNEPPELEIMTAKALHDYKPQGFFSDKNLKKKGFETDEGFDPAQHGYGKILTEKGDQLEQLPQNAIQKALWKEVERILWHAQACFTKKK